MSDNDTTPYKRLERLRLNDYKELIEQYSGISDARKEDLLCFLRLKTSCVHSKIIHFYLSRNSITSEEVVFLVHHILIYLERYPLYQTPKTCIFLSYNEIDYISPDLFGYIPKLCLLDLDGNRILQIDDYSFRGCIYLQSLCISRNKNFISISENALNDLDALYYLSFGNSIKIENLVTFINKSTITVGSITFSQDNKRYCISYDRYGKCYKIT